MAILKPVLLALLGLALNASANPQTLDEGQLRAAMVYKLMLFVEWPAHTPADADLLLCVVSENVEVARAFAVLEGKTLKTRTLYVQRRSPLNNINDCGAVYLNGLGEDRIAGKLRTLSGKSVLTVGSAPQGGAMIDLAVADNRLVFDVSVDALHAAGLDMAPRVLQLARKVYRR